MFQAVREAFGFGKTADPMQQVQGDEAPTLKEMTAVAETYRKSCISWRERAQQAEAELARLKASRERSNANLRRGSAPKVKHPIHGVHSIA